MSPSWTLPAVIAHRCGGALAPENSLAGLEIAAAMGIKGVEFDVQLSADGHPVVIHDDTLERTAGRTGRVGDLRLDELLKCDIGAGHHRAFADERLPALGDIARTCLRLGLVANVEIKCDEADGPRVGGAVTQACCELWGGRTDRLVISSFSESALARAAELAPHVGRALLVERIPDDWAQRARALSCIALHCSVASLSAAAVAEVRGCGFRIAGYTENDATRAGDWFAAGVDALFTDRPDRLFGLGQAAPGALP